MELCSLAKFGHVLFRLGTFWLCSELIPVGPVKQQNNTIKTQIQEKVQHCVPYKICKNYLLQPGMTDGWSLLSI